MTSCTGCGGRLGVLWSTNDAGNRVCRRCFYERLEPTPDFRTVGETSGGRVLTRPHANAKAIPSPAKDHKEARQP